MKYFTPELWESWNKPGYKPPPTDKDPFLLYRKEMETLRNRVNPDVFSFFSEADVHDGELLNFNINDGNRPAPPNESKRPWRRQGNHPVTVTLRVLDSWERYIWALHYTGVRRVEAKYSADQWGNGFDDWGYHEFTDAGGGFFCHEVIFASDSTLLTEFLNVEIERTLARKASEPAGWK